MMLMCHARANVVMAAPTADGGIDEDRTSPSSDGVGRTRRDSLLRPAMPEPDRSNSRSRRDVKTVPTRAREARPTARLYFATAEAKSADCATEKRSARSPAPSGAGAWFGS